MPFLSLRLTMAAASREYPARDLTDESSLEERVSAQHRHTAVWTGTEMIVWGGASAAFGEMSSGGAYCACTRSVFFRDDDGDELGDPQDPIVECTAPPGYVPGRGCD